jgi:hypothetical protein
VQLTGQRSAIGIDDQLKDGNCSVNEKEVRMVKDFGVGFAFRDTDSSEHQQDAIVQPYIRREGPHGIQCQHSTWIWKRLGLYERRCGQGCSYTALQVVSTTRKPTGEVGEYVGPGAGTNPMLMLATVSGFFSGASASLRLPDETELSTQS